MSKESKIRKEKVVHLLTNVLDVAVNVCTLWKMLAFCTVI